jgi:DNA polymerase IV
VSERIVLHLDMDAFFASIEVLCNPSLRGRPLVVGGMPDDRGVVSTASYEARRFGVRSGMPLSRAARLCPQAIFVPCHPAPYVYYSTRILKLFLSRTPNVELFSIDEVFVEGTDLFRSLPRAAEWAAAMQAEIEERTGLTGSFGIGPNKLVAKMASKLRKPRGITTLTLPEFREVFWGRPLEALYGIGEKTAETLMRFGLVTIGDLARTGPDRLRPVFGVLAPDVVASARGQEESPVIPYGEGPPAKSIGHEHTFERDVSNRREIDRLLVALADQVGFALRQEERSASTIHLKIRWSDFTTTVRQTSLREATDRSSDLLAQARLLFRRFDAGGTVRLLGLSVSSLTRAGSAATDSLFERDNHGRRLDSATDELRERYGFGVLRKVGELPEGAGSARAAFARPEA